MDEPVKQPDHYQVPGVESAATPDEIKPHSILHGIRPAKCNRPWASMEGSDTVRTCPVCRLNVYRADGLDVKHLLELVTTTEPTRDITRLKFYRRRDGTLMVATGRCSHLSRDVALGLLLTEGFLLYLWSASLVIFLSIGFLGVFCRPIARWLLKVTTNRMPEILRATFVGILILTVVAAGACIAPVVMLLVWLFHLEAFLPLIILLHVWLAARNLVTNSPPQIAKALDRY